MRIIFDFDHTLFSSKKFYQALQKAFGKFDIDKKLFQKTYEKSKGKNRGYNPSQQFKLIIKQKPEVPSKKLEEEFKRILNQAKQFLYPDVLPTLQKIKKISDLVIISYGKNWFQKAKIKNSEIAKFFKKILITQNVDKIKPFKTLFQDNEKIIFIEDNPSALLAIKKAFPKVITIRINRNEGKYTQEYNNSQIDFSIKNLKELENILNFTYELIPKHVIGVDGGGTKTEFALADLNGKILNLVKGNSSNPRNVGMKQMVENIIEGMKKVKIGKKVDSIFIGLPAVEEEYKPKREKIKKEILKRLKDFKGKIIIDSDQIIAFRSGTDKKDGAVLISGTGCVCHGWKGKKEAKTSGWGWLTDEGSGFWTGQKGLQAVLKELDSGGPKTLVTKLLRKEWKLKNKEDLLNKLYLNFSIRRISLVSKIIDKAADKGDKIAKQIMTDAGKELAKLAMVVIKELNFIGEKFSLVLVGGMFDSKTTYQFVEKEVKKIAPKVQFLKPKLAPVVGAVKLAIENLK